jgi:DNA-binding MarR family transcriptional regulator
VKLKAKKHLSVPNSTNTMENLIGLAAETKAINSKLLSLPRVLIMSALEELPEGEVATFRELKAALGLNDGVLFANLKVLGKMGYCEEQKVKFENEGMTGYKITAQGKADFDALRLWLKKWAAWGDGHGKPW